MTYYPDIGRYQQLVYGGATGNVDCTAWGGALVTDAHTQGAIKLSGRAIRLASSEPIPDRTSPGLTVDQVDAAIFKLTAGRVNLDTPRPGTFARAGFQDRVVDGRWASVAVKRSVLVDRGYGGGDSFRGSHDITVHARDGWPCIGDSLVPYYIRTTWDAVLDAAQAVYNGSLIFASFTRDLTPDYEVSIHPPEADGRAAFWRYSLRDDGTIFGRVRRYTGGMSASCTPPKWHPAEADAGFPARQLVQVTDPSSAFYGWWFDAALAQETNP